MFLGVEFRELDGGGLSLVHEKWLTPRKSSVWWPPYKNQDKFEKSLRRGESPNENWTIYSISKTYFHENNCDKAKKKLKKAEITSEITSNEDSDADNLPVKRIRLPNKRLFTSSDDDDAEPIHSLPSKILGLPKYLSTPKILPTAFKKNNSKLNKSSQPKQVDTISDEEVHSERRQHVVHSSQTAHSSWNNIEKCSQSKRPEFPEANENSDFKTLLHHIIYVRKQNEQILQILKNQNVSQSNTLPTIPVELPLTEIRGIIELEEFLSENENLRSMTNYYSTYGGRDVVTKTNNLLKLFLCNSLAVNYSFKGTRNEKRAFENLLLRRLIIGAVLKSSPTATEVDIDTAIKVWLKHAQKRLTAAEKRQAARQNYTV